MKYAKDYKLPAHIPGDPDLLVSVEWDVQFFLYYSIGEHSVAMDAKPECISLVFGGEPFEMFGDVGKSDLADWLKARADDLTLEEMEIDEDELLGELFEEKRANEANEYNGAT